MRHARIKHFLGVGVSDQIQGDMAQERELSWISASFLCACDDIAPVGNAVRGSGLEEVLGPFHIICFCNTICHMPIL